MPRPKTHDERQQIINRMIGLVNDAGRVTTGDDVAKFGLHRSTA
ncbi:MAG: DUF977 family protein [Silvania sp.]